MSSLKRPGDSEGGTAKYMKVETKAEPNNGVREEVRGVVACLRW